MTFKENLLKKIAIDNLAHEAVRSLIPREGISRIDTDIMKQLLNFSPYEYRRERDLDLYVLPAESAPQHILVLDNGLALYHTSVEDVIIRKSPTIKEMLSLKNAIRILNDSDVLVSKKKDSIGRIRQACIDRLDLNFSPPDIDGLAREGETALGIEDARGVQECLVLFGELLGYAPATKPYRVESVYMLCDGATGKKDRFPTGPVVIYHPALNILKLIDNLSDVVPDERPVLVEKTVFGRLEPAAEGREVIAFLRYRVLQNMSAAAARLAKVF